jgi:hypothetical protein
MYRKITITKLGTIMTFIGILILAACDSSDPPPPVVVKTITITDIPTTVTGSGGTAPTYKIYVQLSAGQTAAAGYIAKGAATTTGGNATITLEYPNGPKEASGSVPTAMTICPKTAADYTAIEVHAGMKNFNSEDTQFSWNSLKDIGTMLPGVAGETRKKEIFDGNDGHDGGPNDKIPGIIWEDEDINK